MAPRSRAVAVAAAIHRVITTSLTTPPLSHSIPLSLSSQIIIDGVVVRRDLRVAQVTVSPFHPPSLARAERERETERETEAEAERERERERERDERR